MLSKVIERPTSEAKIKQHLDSMDEDMDWVYEVPFLTTIENQLRAFQIKINHNILYTNYQLFKWGIVENENCTFCNQQTETLVHIFCKCAKIQNLWLNIVIQFGNIFDRKPSETEILLGMKYIDTVTPKLRMANHILLLAKHFIYSCRGKNNQPVFQNFVNCLKEKERLEYYIAKRNNKLQIHEEKWDLTRIKFRQITSD